MRTRDAPATDSTRITVTLPSALIRALDERLVNGEGTRSAVIRRLIEQEIQAREEHDRREQEEREQVEQFIRAWTEQPETEEELGWLTDPRTLEHLKEAPWE